MAKTSRRSSKPIFVCSASAFSTIAKRSSVGCGARLRGEGQVLCRCGPPGDGEAFRSTSRAGGDVPIDRKVRFAEPVRARASRFTSVFAATGRRAPCRSGEETSASSDENGEREHASAFSGPSSL